MIVYKITNKVNGTSYVGQTTLTTEKRWESHLKAAKYKRDNSAILSAIRKYGEENFTIEIIDTADSIEELNKKEIFWISKSNTLAPNGYNLKLGGNQGGKNSEEAKKKQSDAVKAKYCNGYISPRCGKKLSEQTKQLISIANKGKKRGPLSEEHRAKIGAGHRGKKKPHSLAWRENHRLKMLGHKDSEETKTKRAEKRKKKIVCLTDNRVFNSLKEAALFYGIGKSNLSSLLKGRFTYLTSKLDGSRLTFAFYKDQ